MKKLFKNYAVCWAILLALFNVICFVSPSLIKVDDVEYSKYDGAFWTGYIFIMLAFIGQLVSSYFAFKADSAKKMFYNIPLIKISYGGLIAMIVIGTACMVIPDMPNWVGVIICMIILAFSAISVIKASTAIDIVENIDNKIKAQTQYIKMLTVDAESLMSRATTPEAKDACKKVYEAVRYSDPMSNEALSVIEEKITVKMDEFISAFNDNNAEKISTAADEVLILLSDRNKKCKALK